MDQRLANPFWHAFLLLSTQPHEGEKIQVKKAWGYYPAPMTLPDTTCSQLGTFIKSKLGFDFDLCGNYGYWKSEELRFLDLGYGLHGVTFEISKSQYEQLKKNLIQTSLNEDTAISEMKEKLTTELGEPDSIEIYHQELREAYEDSRPSRLKRFDFMLSLTTNGVTLESSNTCKNMALDALRAIDIPEALLDSIFNSDDASYALPRMSGKMEDIFLHSEGPRHLYISPSMNQNSFFRTWDDKADQLFWTLPPLMVRKHEGEYPFLGIPFQSSLLTAIKNCISMLQQVELVLTNAETNEDDKVNKLKERMVLLYNYFSTLTSKCQPHEVEKHVCSCYLALNNLYFAIRGDCDDHELEAVTKRIDLASQVKICDILGRTHPKQVKQCVMM